MFDKFISPNPRRGEDSPRPRPDSRQSDFSENMPAFLPSDRLDVFMAGLASRGVGT